MLMEWGPPDEQLVRIEIKSPSSAESYLTININNEKSSYKRDNINTTLLPGESTIRLSFKKKMKGKLDVTFYTRYGLNDFIKKITVVN